MLVYLCLFLSMSLFSPTAEARDSLDSLDNLIESQSQGNLKRELRKTVAAVKNRYERLFDPAGLKHVDKNSSKGEKERQTKQSIDEAKLDKMVKRLHGKCKKPMRQSELKKLLAKELKRRGFALQSSKKRDAKLRSRLIEDKRTRLPSRLERLRYWMEEKYQKLME